MRNEGMHVREQLGRLIEESDQSKNTIIREVGIDRSTFYKILSGERRPTPEQLQGILDAVHADKNDRERVIDTYERELAGQELYELRAAVREFLHGLSLKPQAESPAEAMHTFVQRTREMGTDRYLAYLPVGSKCLTQLFALLGGNGEEDTFPEICVLTAREEGQEYGGLTLQGFGHWFRHLSQHAVRFRAYSLPQMTSGLVDTVAFPYYILGEGTILLMSGDETQLLVSENPQVVAAFQGNYERLIAQSEEVACTVTGLREIMEFYTGLCATLGDSVWYLIGARPCLVMCATEDMVRRYMHDEYYVQYKRGLCALPIYDLTYRSGVDRLRQIRQIEELGLGIPVSEEDCEEVCRIILERAGKDYLFLNEERIQISDEWELDVVSHKAAVIQSYHNADYLLVCKSSEIVEPLTEWCESRHLMLTNDIVRSTATA